MIWLIIGGIVLVICSLDALTLVRYMTPRTIDMWLFQLNTSYWPIAYSIALWSLFIGLVIEFTVACHVKSRNWKGTVINDAAPVIVQPEKRICFAHFVLSVFVVLALCIFLFKTDWVALQRNVILQFISTYYSDYFYLPLTDFWVTHTVSINLVIGLIAIAMVFMFLLFLPRIFKKTRIACNQIHQCLNRKVLTCGAILLICITAFLYLDIFSWLRSITIGNINAMIQRYYFLPLTDFIVTGVFRVTLLIPIFTAIGIFGLLFTLKYVVSEKNSVKSSQIPKE